MTVTAEHVEQRIRDRCKEPDFLFFTRYFFSQRFGRKFIVGDHHVQICDVLQKVFRGEITRLIINIAPRYGKTEIAVKNFIACGLAVNPAAKFIHLSYSDDLALDNSEEAKSIVQSEVYQALFPHVKIKPKSDAKKKWYTTAGGGVYATSAAGQVTGFGAGLVDEEIDDRHFAAPDGSVFGGALIIDDPIKPEDADSDTQRDRVNNRFDSTIINRVNSRKTPIIIIMQRLHEKDLCGHVLEFDESEWHVLSMPCIKDDGEPLWPFKHTIEELRKIEKRNPVVFERQYLQKPMPLRGLLFPRSELNYYNPETVDVDKMSVLRFGVIDPANEGGDDLSCISGYLVQDKIYVHDIIYNNDGTDVNEGPVVDWIRSNKLNGVRFEGNSAWYLFGQMLRRRLQEAKSNCTFRIITNHENKHTRILAQAAFIRNHFIFREDFDKLPQYRKFMQNLTSYLKAGGAKHDDAPDSAAELAKYFQEHHKNLW